MGVRHRDSKRERQNFLAFYEHGKCRRLKDSVVSLYGMEIFNYFHQLSNFKSIAEAMSALQCAFNTTQHKRHFEITA